MADGRYIAYYRCSTRSQGQSGLGLEAQAEAVRKFLNGGSWQLLAEYTEVESGTRKGNNRPKLAEALARCKREKATLVIAKIDRLARNVAFVSNLLESGVEFVAVDMPHANKLTIHILSAVAEAEADAISRRTKEALAAAKARGVRLGSPANLTDAAKARGATSNKRQAAKSYAHLDRLLCSLIKEGKTLRQIADYLNYDQNERTRTGALFTAMTIKRILDRASS